MDENLARVVSSYLSPRDAVRGWTSTGRVCTPGRRDEVRRWCAARLATCLNFYTLGYLDEDDMRHFMVYNTKRELLQGVWYLTRELLQAAGWRQNVFESLRMTPYLYCRHPSFRVPKSVKSLSLASGPILLNHVDSRPRVSAVYGCAMASRRVRHALKRSLLLRALVG